MWSLVWVVAVTIPGCWCQWNQQIVIMAEQAEATVGRTSLNLTCSYTAAQMRFLQIQPRTVKWTKFRAGVSQTIFTVNLQSFVFGQGAQFHGDWVNRGIVINQGLDYHTDIQLSAFSLAYTDGGVYQCDMEDANNRHYVNSTTAIVYYGPRDVTVHDDGTKFQVVEGQNLTLFCEADCNPGCNYTWYFGSKQLVSKDGEFYIDKSNRNDTGNYTCVAENDVNNDSTVVQVEVFHGAGHRVWFQPPPDYQNITEGHPFQFTCLAECHPACYLTWNKGDRYFPSKNGTVYLVNASRTDSGLYTCYAINRVTNESRLLDLDVLYGPEASVIISPPGPVYVTQEGVTVNLTCQADCHPDCVFEWLKDGHVVHSSRGVSLPNVMRQQSGSYTCRASNIVDSSISVIKLDVQYEPRIVSLDINSGDNTVGEGKTSTFSCMVDANPIPRVTWTNINTHTIVKQEDKSLDSVYIIHKTDCLNAALYQCSADNGIGSKAKSTIQLYVLCVPRLDHQVIIRPNVLARRGSAAVLSVTVIAYPEASFTWYQAVGFGTKNMTGPRYKINSTDYTSSLTISDIILQDYGNYSVNVTNSQGAYIETFQLSRADSPEMPVAFFCTNHTDGSVKLRWMSQDSNGATQEFHLQYAPSGGEMQNGTVVVKDPGKGKEVFTDVKNLASSTMYLFYLTSSNKFGDSENILTTCFTDKQHGPEKGASTLNFAQGIGAGFAVCLCLIIVGGVIGYLARKRITKYRRTRYVGFLLENQE